MGKPESPTPVDTSWRRTRRRVLFFAFVIMITEVILTIFVFHTFEGPQSAHQHPRPPIAHHVHAGPGPCRAASAQASYQCAIIKDRSALIPGTASYQPSISLPLGQIYDFKLTICGDLSAICLQSHDYHVPMANSSVTHRLWVGARISALLTGNMRGQINNLSPTVQPIIAASDAATWFWTIDPTEAGTFSLTLTVTPLLANSGTPLVAGVPYPIELTVTESTGQQLTHAVSFTSAVIKHLTEVLGALGVTVVGITTFLVRRFRKRRKKKREPSAEVSKSADKSDAKETPAFAAPRNSSHAKRKGSKKSRRAKEKPSQ